MPGSLDKECKVTQNLSGKLLELLRAGNWEVGLSAPSRRLGSLLASCPGFRQPSEHKVMLQACTREKQNARHVCQRLHSC